MKKIFALILVFALFCSMMSITCWAAENDVSLIIIEGTKAVTINATNNMYVQNGTAYIGLLCSPSGATATYIRATSYIEKQYGTQWVVVPLENGDTEWTNMVSGNTMNLVVPQKLLAGAGTYRVTTNYTVYCTGIGNRVASATATATYS